MSRIPRIIYLGLSLFLICSTFTFVSAQDDDDVEIVTEETATVAPMFGVATADGEEDDEDEVTGATLRGRIIYEDSGRPVRYVSVSLVRDEKESQKGGFYSGFSAKYVKTDENGEFAIKNVGAGNYYPVIKSEGILNRNSYRSFQKDSSEDEIFEKITISGLGEFSVLIRAKRGGAISGRIFYADGEAAVGVKVEALKKFSDKFQSSNPYSEEKSVGATMTDDRGAYRFSGLPVGQYIVRVIEPVSHKPQKAEYDYSPRGSEQSNILRTYFPEGENSKDAKVLDIERGQEQTEININLPERKLFSVSGRVVLKKGQQPIKDFEVSFYKLSDVDDGVFAELSRPSSIRTNKEGLWSLRSLPKGKYSITASQGYVYRSDEKEKTPEYPRITKEIEITDSDLSEIIFEIPAESSFSGTITVDGGKDVPNNVNLFIFNSETHQGASTYDYMRSDEKNPQPTKQKAFRVGKLTGGKYVLNFSYSEFYIKSATLGGKDILNDPFEIGEGEEVKDAKIVLATDFGKFNGRVENFEPDIRTFVVLVKNGIVSTNMMGSSFSTPVKANGEFEIKAAPGEYKVVAVKESSRPKNEKEFFEWFESLIKNASTVTIRVNETETGNLTAQ